MTEVPVEETEEVEEDEIPQSEPEVPENTNTTPDVNEEVEVLDNETPLAQTGDNIDVLLIAFGAALLSLGVAVFKRR